MKQLILVLFFLTTFTVNAQKFILDSTTISTHNLVFDTSTYVHNEDFFLLQNIFIMEGADEDKRRKENSGMPTFSIYSKKNQKVMIFNILCDNKKVGNFKSYIQNTKMYEEVIDVGCCRNYLYEPRIKGTNTDYIAKVNIDIIYKVGKKKKKFHISEAKVVWPLIKWNYFKERLCAWKAKYSPDNPCSIY